MLQGCHTEQYDCLLVFFTAERTRSRALVVQRMAYRLCEEREGNETIFLNTFYAGGGGTLTKYLSPHIGQYLFNKL